MFVFEVKPKNRWIAFGKLERPVQEKWNWAVQDFWLRDADGWQWPQRFHFYKGNYILSIVSTSEGSSAIIHQENVDPNKLIQILLESPASDGNDDDRIQVGNRSKFTAISPIGLNQSTSDKNCKICKENPDNRFEHPKMTPMEAKILHQIYAAHKTEGQVVAKAKALQYRDLFCFIDDRNWKNYRNWKNDRNWKKSDLEIASVDSMYELRLGEQKIGFAVNIDDMVQGEMRGLLFFDSTGSQYALMLKNIPGPSDDYFIDAPIESVLYDTEYRRFQKGNKRMKNDFYGSEDSFSHPQFDFHRLPSYLFVKIFNYLPWNERVVCRRVSKLWFEVGNMALERSTKAIVSSEIWRSPFGKMETLDLERLLPIVAGGLEKLVLHNEKCALGLPTPTPTFRSLRDVNVGLSQVVSYENLVQFLDHCPNLKKLTLEAIPAKPPNSAVVPSTIYQFEELVLLSHRLTNQDLLAIADLFPNLVSLSINDNRFLSKPGLSLLIERLGNLRSFSITHNRKPREIFARRNGTLNASVFSKLTSLSITQSVDLATDEFVIALANECPGLESLDLYKSLQLTRKGLAALASLSNLKKLNININSGGVDLSEEIIAIAKNGKLREFCCTNGIITGSCIYMCKRYCPGLKITTS